MSVVNTLSRSGHFSEFNSPLVTAAGVLTPQQRKQLAMDNLTSGFTDGAGTVATSATTAAVEALGTDGVRTTSLALTAFALGNGGDGADLGIGALVYTFPAGNVQFIDATLSGNFGTTVLYTNALDAGLGSVIASGVVAVLGGTATFEDFIGSLTTAVLPGGAVVGMTGQAAAAGIGNRMIAASAAHTVHLNAAGSWTNIAAAGPVTFTGNIVLRWKLIV